MTAIAEENARKIVQEAIAAVAPDVEDEIAGLDPGADLFEALALDSMDHLTVMTELFERTGVEIAEGDYPRLRSVEALAEQLVDLSGA